MKFRGTEELVFLYVHGEHGMPTWTLDTPHSGIRTSSWTSSCISHFISKKYNEQIQWIWMEYTYSKQQRSTNLPDPCQGIKWYFSSFTRLYSLLTDYLFKIRREIFCLRGCFVVSNVHFVLCSSIIHICFWYDDDAEKVRKKLKHNVDFQDLLEIHEKSSRVSRPFEFHVQTTFRQRPIFLSDMNCVLINSIN